MPKASPIASCSLDSYKFAQIKENVGISINNVKNMKSEDDHRKVK